MDVAFMCAAIAGIRVRRIVTWRGSANKGPVVGDHALLKTFFSAVHKSMTFDGWRADALNVFHPTVTCFHWLVRKRRWQWGEGRVRTKATAIVTDSAHTLTHAHTTHHNL